LDLGLHLKTTVFLGLYKSEEYVKERIQDLAGQTSQDFYLVIVDNCSPGFDLGAFSDLLESSKKFTNRYMVVQNPINLGGLGSFRMNLDLVPTAWITFFHQDDEYLPNHVATHLQAITAGNEFLSSVSTDLGSLNSEGKKAPVPPRANWFIGSSSNQAIFLANVAEQVVPFASLSMRKASFEAVQVPMHTVAFSDSEQTLKSLMIGDHEFVKKQTVLYRENPISESHTQGAKVRTFSATRRWSWTMDAIFPRSMEVYWGVSTLIGCLIGRLSMMSVLIFLASSASWDISEARLKAILDLLAFSRQFPLQYITPSAQLRVIQNSFWQYWQVLETCAGETWNLVGVL
jgi:hypothetical protein